MTDGANRSDTDKLRKALEKTVPSAEFSVDGTRRELEQTPVAETPPSTAQQYLLKTKTDPSGMSDMDDSSPVVGFSTTSMVPPELLDSDDQEGPRFDVTGEAGRGGTAHVYTVVDRSLGRTIALKLLRGKAQGKKGIKQRFIHEARVTAMLEHPNIVPVYDIGVTEDNRVYFLMKNVTGVSVGDAIRAARDGGDVPAEFRTIDARLRILLKVCDALAFAHDKGYIHQDIKPDNIMLGSFGEVLVLDWGCAIGEKERAGGTAATYGTPAYMSPEQARQENADERSDVYCLGATLYQMITLCHPTWSDDPNEFWEMKRRGALSDLPEQARASVPDALLAVVRTAMAPDPARRYQSVLELQHAITEYQEHAESIALAHRASERLDEVGNHAEYHEYARITARFDQALEMWSDNRDALAGRIRALRCHALRALERGDLELAASIAGEDCELVDIREQVERERRRRRRNQQRARRTLYAAGVLGVVLLAVFGYYVADYFRYFGKWQRLYRIDFTEENADLGGLVFSESVLTREEEPDTLTPEGLRLATTRMFWARNVRERGDVRVEVVVEWPEGVDGLEIMLNARREQGSSFAKCPTGYCCQFGGWDGVINVISRNDNPRYPDQGNSVGCDLEPGRTYRLWFQRVGEELSLFVGGRRVFRIVDPLPLAGEGLEWVAVRSWADVVIKSFTAWRMGAPEKTSPLIAGDMFVQRGRLADAAEVYLRLAQDHAGSPLEEQALTRAYLAASQVDGADSLRPRIREIMRASHPHSSYWPLLFEADCMTAWKADRFEQALSLAAEALERSPDSRIALRMISGRPDSVPVWAIDSTLRLLSRTTGVYGLSLEDVGISDIGPLRGLPIRSLALRQNNIADLSPLQGMPLELLLINSNPVSDLSPLKGMQLATLEATSCDIDDIGPLAGMPLGAIDLESNRISDIGPLAGMPLTVLDLSYNPITSLEPLRGTETLRRLNIDSTAITDLEPLRGLHLQTLQLAFLTVTSVEPLRGMPLRALEMEYTRVADLSPLRGMPLTGLDLTATAVSSLEPLKGMRLIDFYADHCGLRDLSALAGMPLRVLRLSNNDIRDLSPLHGMELHELTLRNNDVRDLSPLAGVALRVLQVGRNPLESLKPFEENPPERMVFDTVTAGPGYTESVLERWERMGDTVSARLSRVALAFRRGDTQAMRRLAAPLRGHRYLHVPVPLTFDKARHAAERVGGHLVTVTSNEEFRLAYSLLPNQVGAWIGIDVAADTARWLTGEPLAFQNFVSRYDRMSPLPKYMLRRYNTDGSWYAATYTEMNADLIIEWDF